MRKGVLILAFITATFAAHAQYGGIIRALNNSGVIGEIMRRGTALKTDDSLAQLKIDSLRIAINSFATANDANLNNVDADISSGNTTLSSIEAGITSINTVQTNGAQKSITRGGAKGTTTAADVTSTASGANHQTLDVAIYNASGTQITSFGDSTAGSRQNVNAKLYGQDSINIAGINTKLGGTLTVGTHAVTQSGTWNINNTPSASDSNKYRFLIGVQNMYSVNASDSVKYRYKIGFDRLKSTTDTVQANITGTVPVSGTFWQSTQPVSAASLPLPTGAATSANQTTGNSSLSTIQTSTTDMDNILQTVQGSIGNLNLAQGSTTSGQTGNLILGAATTSAPTYTTGKSYPPSFNTSGGMRVDGSGVTQPVSGTFWQSTQPVSLDSNSQRKGVVIVGGSITATSGATAIYDSVWAVISMDTTGLANKASSQTVGWISDTIRCKDRQALDYKVGILLQMANTAPANDKAVYVYLVPWFYDGSGYNSASGGTTTMPPSTKQSYTIATPNDFRLLGVMSYTTQQMNLQDVFLASNAFGANMPDAFSIFILDYSGAALAASTHKIKVTPLNKVQR